MWNLDELIRRLQNTAGATRGAELMLEVEMLRNGRLVVMRAPPSDCRLVYGLGESGDNNEERYTLTCTADRAR